MIKKSAYLLTKYQLIAFYINWKPTICILNFKSGKLFCRLSLAFIFRIIETIADANLRVKNFHLPKRAKLVNLALFEFLVFIFKYLIFYTKHIENLLCSLNERWLKIIIEKYVNEIIHKLACIFCLNKKCHFCLK